MSFVKDSFKYSFKNFFRLLVFVLPVSILIGFLNPYRTITFLSTYQSTKISNFWDMLQSTISINPLNLVLCLVALVLLIVTISVVLSSMEFQMRTGKFSYSQGFKRCHYFIIPVISLFAMFLILLVALVFLMPAVNYFIHYMLSGLGNVPTKTTHLVCGVIYLLGYLIAFMFLTVLLVAINLVSLNSYSVKSALSNSLNLLEGNFFKYFTAILCPYVIIIPVVLLTHSLKIYPLISIALFTIQLVFILSVCMISYFKFSGTARKDNPTGYFIKGAK